MILGCPIAFCLLCSGTIYFMTNNMALIMVVQRLTEGANTFTLLAVPGFILAGNLMNSGEVTDRIFDFCGKLVGHITGGLGHANILASVVFAGMSGAAIADAGGLGAIELKAMHDAGYDDDFSLAVTGASSLVGPIIPPSVPAVVYGTVASVSIGRLFMAGAVPGAIMAIAMCVMVYIISKKRGYRKEEWCGFRALFHSFRRAFLSLLTVVVILGGILAGINYYEFKYREADFGSYPKGLMYGLQVLDSWLYDDRLPFIHIEANNTFAELRKEVKTGYFEGLVQKYLLDNTHRSVVILQPKLGLLEEQEQKQREKMAQVKTAIVLQIYGGTNVFS